MQHSRKPEEQGLYSPAYEHDACGVGLLVNIHGGKSHQVVENALQVLEHMNHRGAEGADPNTGDGAGIMVQIPHEFILLQGIPVPEKGRYGTGLIFLPKEKNAQAALLDLLESEVFNSGLQLLATRDVPVNSDILGEGSSATEPAIKQIFVTSPHDIDEEELGRQLYVLRKKIEARVLKSDIE